MRKDLIETPIDDTLKDTLLNKINIVSLEIKEINEEIESILKEISIKHGHYTRDLMELEVELKEKGIQPPPTKSKNDPHACNKKIFQEIAKECHPDKTEDIERHNLFREAKKALDNNSTSDLVKILKILKNKEKYEYNYIEELKKELKTKTHELILLKTSKIYTITKNYQSNDRSKVWDSIKDFNNLIFDKMKEILDKLNI